MFRPARSGAPRALALLFLALSPPAFGAGPFEVGGTVVPGEDALLARVELRNTGEAAMEGPVELTGTLLGNRADARLEGTIPAREARTIELSFPPEVPRHGIHALRLLVSYSVGGVATSQAAYLLLALGGAPEPALRLFVGESAFELRGVLEVGLESADGEPHAARLRVTTPRGLRAEEPAAAIAVPATGRAVARVVLLRTGAGHDTRHGIVVAAEAEDGAEARTTVATGVARILPDPGIIPRIRLPILALAFLLLAASLFVEIRRLRRSAS